MNFKKRIWLTILLLGAANLIIWAAALLTFRHFAVLLVTASLAYTLGLRHALDADHISAIDNVTRKLLQDGKKPLLVGFFFSLGHSTIVILLSVAIALTASGIRARFPGLEKVGGVVGTSVSAFFLVAIACISTGAASAGLRPGRRHRHLRARSRPHRVPAPAGLPLREQRHNPPRRAARARRRYCG